MASKSVRDNLAKNLLKKLSKEQNEQSAKRLKSRRPQILFLKDLKFVEELIEKIKVKGYIPKSVRVIKSAGILDEARNIAKGYQDAYIKNNLRYKRGPQSIENTHGGMLVKSENPSVFKQIIDGTAFILQSWRELGECKETIITLAVNATEEQLDEIIKRVDRGHGAGAGFAVSQVTGARALGKADASLNKIDKEALLNDLRNAGKDSVESGKLDPKAFDDIERLTIEYSQIVTPTGRIAASYIPIVTFQDKYTNRGVEAAREKQVLKFLRNYFANRGAEFIATLPGSSTLVQKATAVAIKPLIEVKNGKATISAEIDPKKVKLKSKGKPAVQNAKSERGSLKRKKAKVGVVAKGRTSKAKQSTVSIASLISLMNAKINTVVADNMGDPRLNYRTGRFAASVRITDIATTPKGFPSIGYRYQTDPYSVFESTSGTRFASINRDPRTLIDASIREIASQLAIGRVYTRKV